MLDLLTLCTKMMQHSAFFKKNKNKLTKVILLKFDWLCFLTDMSRKRNYISILILVQSGWSAFGRYNILPTDCLVLCILI